MIDLPTLKALAAAATPGPYDVPPPHRDFGFAVWANGMCVARFGHAKFDEHNAEYFVAASPATVLALIARVEDLEANRLTPAEREVIEAAIRWNTNDQPGLVLTERNDPVMHLQTAVAALLKERGGK
jgi:hypothetical protein